VGGFLIQRQPGHPGFFLLNYQHHPPPPTRGNEEGHAPIAELIQGLTKAQQVELAGHYKQDYDAGKALAKATDVLKLRGLHKLIAENFDANNWKTAAFILGRSSTKLTAD
jgi:hypothetical protein